MVIETPIKNKGLHETRGLIAGEWKTAKDGKTFAVYEPSSGKVLAQCSDFGLDDFKDAIDSATRGFKSFYKSTTAKERSILLKKWNQLILDNIEDCELAPGPLFYPRAGWLNAVRKLIRCIN